MSTGFRHTLYFTICLVYQTQFIWARIKTWGSCTSFFLFEIEIFLHVLPAIIITSSSMYLCNFYLTWPNFQLIISFYFLAKHVTACHFFFTLAKCAILYIIIHLIHACCVKSFGVAVRCYWLAPWCLFGPIAGCHQNAASRFFLVDSKALLYSTFGAFGYTWEVETIVS